MVYVNLWPPNPSAERPWPHGTVHRHCSHTRHYPSPKWRIADDEHAADRDFPNHRLFWCTDNRCFGPNNPRQHDWAYRHG